MTEFEFLEVDTEEFQSNRARTEEQGVSSISEKKLAAIAEMPDDQLVPRRDKANKILGETL